MSVTLEPITDENLAAVFDLEVADGQRSFVAPNPWSLAQAFVKHDLAWARAIVADNTVVGFLMLEVDPHEPSGHPYFLWRLMVGADHQRKGYGRAGVALAVDEVRRRGGTTLVTAWVDAEGGPQPFYEKLGFAATGEIDDGEVVAMLCLD